MPKKIYVTKTDSLASIVGKVVRAKEDDITLYVPRGTDFAASRTNFILLKREVTTAGKTITIESVDDDALELADTAGIKAINPFLHRRQKAVSDIVAIRPRESVLPVAPKEKSETEEEAALKEGEPRPETGREEVTPAKKEEKREKPKILDKGEATPRRFVKAVVITAVLAVVFVFVMTLLPRAKIALSMEQKDLEFVGNMTTSDAVKENSFSRDLVSVRGATFVERRNVTKSYPASDKKQVERKATGELVIYNNFSTASQGLVATTRFVSPDGRIYRLDNTITVPGAEMSGGKLVPRSVKARVTADKAGEEYNLAAGVKLRIPGFQGTAKYDGFYAETRDPISGGFVGVSSLPSETDLTTAKEDAMRALEDVIKTQLLFNLPPEVKVLNNAYQFKITDTKVNDSPDESDKFTITAFGEAKLVGFREPELVEALGKGLIGGESESFKPENYELEYGEASLGADGTLNVPLKFKSLWKRTLDIDAFKREAAGKDKARLQDLILSIPGLQMGEARLWPFWVTKVPPNPDRIIVDVK